MEMFSDAISSDRYTPVVHYRMPEEVGSITPCFLSVEVGNSFKTDYFRNLRIGMHTGKLVFFLKKRIQGHPV